MESTKVLPEPLFLQAEPSMLPQPFLIGLVLQAVHHLRWHSLDLLQSLNVLPESRGPELVTVLDVCHLPRALTQPLLWAFPL